MSKPEVVAEGTVQAYVHPDKGPGWQRAVDLGPVRDVGFRSCKLGTASCRFSDVNIECADSDGVVAVQVLCGDASSCGSSSENLQSGLNSLPKVAK